jgi:hypothetical protein
MVVPFLFKRAGWDIGIQVHDDAFL